MYLVIEMQLNNGVLATLSYQFTELSEAYAKYHSILSVAAVSAVEVHSAVILTETGRVVASEHFAHETVVEEVTEE